jgi:integrase
MVALAPGETKERELTWLDYPTPAAVSGELIVFASGADDAIDRVLRKYARSIGIDRGYSAHSMRATFITTALDNGASLEDVQSAAGHADPSTTKLYDRRGYNPEKSASFFANY